MKPNKYRLSQYTDKSYDNLADEFESHFLQEHYKTSAKESIRDRFECNKSEVDHWINSLGLDINGIDAMKFKSALFSKLKKRSWSVANIPGRWQKTIFK